MKELKTKIIRFASKTITSKEKQASFIKGVNRSIYMYLADRDLNSELAYSDLTKDIFRPLKSKLEKTKEILASIPEQSLLKIFSNSSNDLRSILHKASFGHSIDESTTEAKDKPDIEAKDEATTEVKDKSGIEVIPEYKKHLFDALITLTYELQSQPHEILDLLFQLLVNGVTKSVEIKDEYESTKSETQKEEKPSPKLFMYNSQLESIKGKQLEIEYQKELVYNVAYEFVLYGGSISCADTGIFTEIIADIFNYLFPKKERSISNFLIKTCGGEDKIMLEIKHKRRFKA